MSWLASHSIPSSLPPPLSSCSRGRCSSVPPCHTETQKQKQKHRKKTQNNSPYIVQLQQCGVFLLVKHTEKEKQKQREKAFLVKLQNKVFQVHTSSLSNTHTEIKRFGHLVRDTELTNEKREELLILTKEEKTSEILSSASWRRSLKWLTFKWTRGSCCQRNTETGELNIEHWILNQSSRAQLHCAQEYIICWFTGVSNLHRGKICKFIPESIVCLLPSHFAKRHYHDCGWGNGYIGQLPRDMILIMVRGRWYHRSIAKS